MDTAATTEINSNNLRLEKEKLKDYILKNS
jgi:hypothetical protein